MSIIGKANSGPICRRRHPLIGDFSMASRNREGAAISARRAIRHLVRPGTNPQENGFLALTSDFVLSTAQTIRKSNDRNILEYFPLRQP